MRTLGLLLITLTFSMTVNAQSTKTSYSPQTDNITLSPSLGLVFTDFKVKGEDMNYQPKAGWSVGIDVNVPTANSYVDYQTGLAYSISNTNFNDSTTETTGTQTTVSSNDMTIQLQRISLPIFAKIYPLKKSSRFYTKMGILTHYLLEGKSKGSWSYTSTDSTAGPASTYSDSQSYNVRVSQKDGLRALMADAVAGLGYGFNITDTIDMTAELNYQYGISGITNGSDDVRANTVFASAGMRF